MLNDEMISLANLDGGALQELFEAQLPPLLDNIADPNTKAEAVREITINIKIKPTKTRREADVTYGAKLKLASQQEGSTTVYFTTGQDGERVAAEYPQDQEMGFDAKPEPEPEAEEETGEEGEETDGKVVNMRKE